MRVEREDDRGRWEGNVEKSRNELEVILNLDPMNPKARKKLEEIESKKGQ